MAGPPVSEGAASLQPSWITGREKAIWRDFLDVTRLLLDRLNRQLVVESGMTLAEFEVLVRLSEADGRRLRMSELADLVVNSRSRLTHTVRRLENRGWVIREECEEDRRGIRCVLLDDGRAVLGKAAPGYAEAVHSIIFDPLTHRDIESLGGLMHKIKSELR
jgi:DNA-binding MarR family transcriptional regulator